MHNSARSVVTRVPLPLRPVVSAPARPCAWLACPDKHARPSLSRYRSWAVTQGRKWAVAPSFLSSAFHFAFPLCSTFCKQQKFALSLQGYEKLKISPKCIYYTKANLITIVFNYNLNKNWVFFQEFTKYKNKAKSSLLFFTRVLDVSPCPEYLRYLKMFFHDGVSNAQ